MKNYKVYKLLIITLLLSVSVFCYLYLSKLENANEVQSEVLAEDTTSKPEETVEEEKEIYYNTLPKNPIKSSDYTIQNIGGTSADTFNMAYEIKGYTYVIFSTLSNDYDVHSENASVCVAKLQDLELLNILTLDCGEDTTFIDSKIYNDGFYILSGNENNSFLFTVNFDNINTKVMKITNSTSSLYMYNNELLIVSTSNNMLTFSKLKDFSIEYSFSSFLKNIMSYYIFENGENLDIIVNTDADCTILAFNIISGFISSKSILNYSICEIIPFLDGYAGILYDNTNYYIFTSDKSLASINKVAIGNNGYYKIIQNKDNLLLYRNTDISSTITLYCKHLDIILENTTSAIQNILYIDYNKGSIIGYNDNKISIYALSNYNFVLDYSLTAENKKAYILSNGVVCYSSNFLGNDYFRNYGNSDVFLVKKS